MKKDSQLELYTLVRYKEVVLVVLAIITLVMGYSGFYMEMYRAVRTGGEYSLLHPLVQTVGLFVFEWDNYAPSVYLDIATLSGVMTTSFGLFWMFFSKYFNAYNISRIQKKHYNIIIGLSEQNIELLENSYSGKPTIIIEKNKDNPYVEYFRERGFGMITLDAQKAIPDLDLSRLDRVVISTDNDRKNIAFGKQILELLKLVGKKDMHNIYVAIDNRDLSVLFKQNIVGQTDANVNVLAFSLYENMAKRLFSKHNILGLQSEIIETAKEFSLVVVGDSDLALEIVYHIAFLSALPNENSRTIHLIDADAGKFKEKIKKTFPNIESIPHLEIKKHDVDTETLDFYKDNVWTSKNLTNIYIATHNEEKNLKIAINLQDTTYVKAIGHNKFNTKVLFALYHNLGLGDEINNNENVFKNFYTFGSISKTSTREILFDQTLDDIAKLIDFDYRKMNGVHEKVSPDELEKAWLNTAPHIRDVNKTQALHIDMKLLAFGFTRKDSKEPFKTLLANNKKIFYTKIENSKQVEEEINNYKLEYYPKTFNERMIDSVARSEHNRWNAYHYLNGWSYNKVRNNEAKEHNCLQLLEEFGDTEKMTYQYDLAAVFNLPKYLAHAGFEIVESK